MAGSRIHDKLHRANHHTLSTVGIPDSASDPIASSDFPFIGNFYLSGGLNSKSSLSADSNSANATIIITQAGAGLGLTSNASLSTANTLYDKNGNSGQWNSSYSSTISNSANWVLNNGNSNDLTIGTIGISQKINLITSTNPRITILGSDKAGFIGVNTQTPNERLTIVGNVSTQGNSITTGILSAMSNAFISGSAGIGTNIPNEKLTVVGNISSSNIIYDLSGNSSQWNTTNTISALSSNWQGTFSTVSANSGFWNTINTTNTISALSSNWQGTFSTVSTNSGFWNRTNTISALSSNWQGSFSTVNANSAYWNTTNTISSLSSNWILDGGNSRNANISIGTNDAYNLNLETNNVTKVTVTSSGNVGVGINTPTELLHVNGNIKTAGIVEATNSAKAWVNFDGRFISNTGKTYSRSGTTVTITNNSHGLSKDNVVIISAATDTSLNGSYKVATVPTLSTFTITSSATGATTGTLTYVLTIRTSYNVSSVIRNGVGDYSIVFSIPMTQSTYVIAGTCRDTGGADAKLGLSSSLSNYVTGFRVSTNVTDSLLVDSPEVGIVIFGN